MLQANRIALASLCELDHLFGHHLRQGVVPVDQPKRPQHVFKDVTEDGHLLRLKAPRFDKPVNWDSTPPCQKYDVTPAGGSVIQLRCRRWRSALALSLCLLLGYLPLKFGTVRQSHPNGCKVNHRSPIRGTHHLTSANKVVLRLAAILLGVHKLRPLSKSCGAQQTRVCNKGSDQLDRRMCFILTKTIGDRCRDGSVKYGATLRFVHCPVWVVGQT